ncbi:MAG: endospore germination permease [Thermoflavifilum sp.]|nr:endospore germination permease [Thermoflavifilum sp.]MCL6514233.1 spore germination protein [Alicyclobacillus sp.]
MGVLALSRLAAEAGGSGAPLVTLLGVLVSTGGLRILTKLGTRFPRESIVGYSTRLIGPWCAAVISGVMVLFFAALTALTAREFAEVVVTSVLTRTPVEVTTLTMLLLTALSSRANMTSFAYAHLFYLPFVMPGLLIVVLSTKNGDYLNLLPLIGNAPQVGSFVVGALAISALFQGAFIMAFVIPAMRQPEKAMRSVLWGIGVAGGLYLLIVLATVAVFGAEATREFLWPTLELARMTLLPGEVLERLDAAFLVVWVTAVFTTLYSTYNLTLRAARDLFRMEDHRPFALFLLPYIMLMAMLPTDVVHLYLVMRRRSRTGTIGLGAARGRTDDE